MKKQDILFEHRRRYQVTRGTLKIEGRKHEVANIAQVTEETHPLRPARLVGLGVLIVAAGAAAWSLGQTMALPFVAMLAIGVVLSARSRQHSVLVSLRDGRVERITSQDVALIEGLARAVRRAMAFHSANQRISAG